MSIVSYSLRLSSTLSLLAVTGCATIISGTTEQIAVNTNPPGANCDFVREGQRVAEITSTPASTLIRKAKYDITIICHKAGYQDASYLNHSGAAGSTIGNIVLGGFIGWGIDSATGSDNYYDPAVNMTLAPAAAPSPPVSRAEPGAAPQS